MTDAQLLDLLQRKSPDQLSLLELERLRQRLAASQALREELLARRGMRDYLMEALERLDVDPAALLADLPVRRSPRARALRLAAWLAVAAGIVASGAIAWGWRPWLSPTATTPAARETAPAGELASGTATSALPEPGENNSAAAALQSAASQASPASVPETSANGAAGSQAASDVERPSLQPLAPVPRTPSGPWDEALRDDVPAAKFSRVAFRPFPTSKATPSREELAKWLTPMNAHAQFGERRTSVGACGSINGLFRLHAPWREDASLRFAVEDYDRLKIHCFHGERGVTLAFYQGLNFAWAAYQTTRQPAAPQPDRYVLAATDGGRAMRTEIRHGGPYELRWRAGELVLSRGDVAVLRAPLAWQPTEAFFDGQATFTGLAMVKTEDFPLSEGNAESEGTPLAAGARMAATTLAWKPPTGQGVEFKKHAEGAVELTANNAPQRGWVAAPLPGDGLREIILKIDAATPGAGVFLGRGPNGNPYEVVKFLRDQRTGRLGLSLHGDDDTHERHFESVEERIAPLVPEPVWLRLLFGCGILRCWLSVDGIHWAEPFFDPRTHLPGDVTHVGLHVVANRPDCRLRVTEVVVRRLPAFRSLVAADLHQAPAFPQAADYGDWLTQVSGAQPPEVDNSAWRRACGVNTLAAGCPLALGDALLNALLDEAQTGLPVERQLALLHEAALLLDLRSDHNRLNQYWARFHRVAEDAYRSGDPRPFSLIRQAMMTAPVASPHQSRLSGERLIRTELVELSDGGQASQTLAFCEMLRFYRLDENVPLAAWARAAAQRQAPDQSAEGLVEQRDVWRHPLVEELSKDAYNFLAEFQALLDSDAFEDAARTIAATEPHAAAGVAADRRDPRLFVSLPAALRLALRDWAPLRQVMEERYAELAQLRVRRAIQEGDAEGVRSVALQFDATPAAGLASRWLGDRALSRGHFEQALACYERAERTADPALRAELAPRQRLAGAMLGREIGSPVGADVAFGEVRIGAAEFETMISQLRQRAAATPETVVAGAVAAPRLWPAPQPVGFASQVRARLDGPAGDRANELPRHVREAAVDWAARQLSCVVEGDTLYVNNRFHAAAYDLNGGQRRWQSPPPPGKVARTHDWSLVPMRPLVTEKHVLLRQLTGDGPVLACLDKQTGQVVWTSQPPAGEWLASDPLIVQGRLLLFRVRPIGAREAVLVLCDYDFATGEPRDQQELVRLREPAWTARYVCQAAVVEDAIVVALGGCVACVDLAGGLRWVRKQLYLPPDEDLGGAGQHHEPPLAVPALPADERGEPARQAERKTSGVGVLLAQPGVRAIECVDADTGRSRWTRVLPDGQRLIGVVEDRCLVETAAGFLALHLDDGRTLWRQEAEGRLDACLAGGPGELLFVRQAVGERDDATPRPELVWLNPRTGEERASFALHDLKRQEIRFGPLVAHKDRLWAFVGAGPQDPHRDFVELAPQGVATRPLSLVRDVWLRQFPPALQAAGARVLPNWQPFRGIADKPAGYYSELHGERDVFSLEGSRSQPVVLARRLTIPRDGRARLRVRLAMDPLRNAQLHVEFRGERLWEQTLDEQTLGARQWRDFEADLASRAGQTGWLIVRLVPNSDERFTSLWKRLEVAF